jgi:hypothetical protein
VSFEPFGGDTERKLMQGLLDWPNFIDCSFPSFLPIKLNKIEQFQELQVGHCFVWILESSQ